jgi:integrase
LSFGLPGYIPYKTYKEYKRDFVTPKLPKALGIQEGAMRQLLDDEKLGKLKSKTKRYFEPDKCPGLYVCVHPTGKMVWTFIQRLKAKAGGRLFKKTLGVYPVMTAPEAREKAAPLFKLYEAGRDPGELAEIEIASQAAAQSETVQDIGERWLEESQKATRSYLKVCQFFFGKVAPTFGDKPISSITSFQIQKFLDDYKKKTSGARANRVRSWLNVLFKWAAKRCNLPSNPVDKTEKFPEVQCRERTPDPHELVEIWKGSNSVDYDPQAHLRRRKNQYCYTGLIWSSILKLLILLGSRRAEISGLRWSEVKLKEGILQLPGWRTKRHPKHKDEERTIYLSRQAVEILAKVPRRLDSEFVFPAASGKTPVNGGWNRAVDRLYKIIAANRRERGIKEDMPHFVIHDFRRGVASGLQALGVRIEVTETILGHTSGSRSGIVKVYQRHKFEKESKEAVQLWADKIDDYLAGKFDEDEKEAAAQEK